MKLNEESIPRQTHTKIDGKSMQNPEKFKHESLAISVLHFVQVYAESQNLKLRKIILF